MALEYTFSLVFKFEFDNDSHLKVVEFFLWMKKKFVDVVAFSLIFKFEFDYDSHLVKI